jgi:hypothetical protein
MERDSGKITMPDNLVEILDELINECHQEMVKLRDMRKTARWAESVGGLPNAEKMLNHLKERLKETSYPA